MSVVPAPITGSAQTTLRNIIGWNFCETTATDGAHVRFGIGDSSGDIILSIKLSAGESVGDTQSALLSLPDALYVEVVDGSIEGAVYGK